jgi:hypothetical protein
MWIRKTTWKNPDLEGGLPDQLMESHNAADGGLAHAGLHVVVGLQQPRHYVAQVLAQAPRALLLHHLGQHIYRRLDTTTQQRPVSQDLWLTVFCGSMTLDPDPAIFVIDLQDGNKKIIFLYKVFPYYFLKGIYII